MLRHSLITGPWELVYITKYDTWQVRWGRSNSKHTPPIEAVKFRGDTIHLLTRDRRTGQEIVDVLLSKALRQEDIAILRKCFSELPPSE